jgi:hypothetical protein
MPGRDELPGTLMRSPRTAQERLIEAHDAANREQLRDVARKLDIPGRSTMTKSESVAAIQEANREAHGKARAKK